MGLDCSHDAFHGSYGAFSRFRDALVECIGGRVDRGNTFEGEKSYWWFPEGMNSSTNPGLYEFFSYSDCDGEISPEMCARLADEMEAILPFVEKWPDNLGGHIERDGGFVAVTKRWIKGCRAAALEGVPLEFG